MAAAERVPFDWLRDSLREQGVSETTIAEMVTMAEAELTVQKLVIARQLAASPHATFTCCPMCSGEMLPEHAHYRCGKCGWRDSCCD